MHSLHECVRAAIVQLDMFDIRTSTVETVRADERTVVMASAFQLRRSGLGDENVAPWSMFVLIDLLSVLGFIRTHSTSSPTR